MLGRNVTICRILEYKVQKTFDILFRTLYLILLRFTSQPCRLLTYRLETRWLASRNQQSDKRSNCLLASRNLFVGLMQFDRLATCWFVTLHLLACNLVILTTSILIQSLINPIKIGIFKESIFLAESLHPLFRKDVTYDNIKSH